MADRISDIDVYYYLLRLRDTDNDDNIDRDEEWLNEQLVKANKVFQHGAAHARAGAIEGLRAVIGYLRDNICDPSLASLAPLQELLVALESLRFGEVRPLLRPPKGIRSGTLLAADEHHFHHLLCLLVNEFKKAQNVTLKLARGCIADRLNRVGYRKQRGGAITAKTLSEWATKSSRILTQLAEERGQTLRQYEVGNFYFPALLLDETGLRSRYIQLWLLLETRHGHRKVDQSE